MNGRVVADRILGAVLREVYAGLLPRGRHPAAVVNLSLPPEAVDVNVHPAKTEIRFHDSGKVYPLLLTALRQGLGPLHGESPRYRVTWQPEAPPGRRKAPLPDLFPPENRRRGRGCRRRPGSLRGPWPRAPFPTPAPATFAFRT